MNYIYLSICIGMSLIGRCQECPDDIWIFHKSHKKVPELLAAAGRRVKETVLTLSLENWEYHHHGNTSADRPSHLYPATYLANIFNAFNLGLVWPLTDWDWQCVLYWGKGVGRLGHWAIYIYIHSDWTLDQPDGLKDKSWACVVQIVGGRKSALHGENVSCIPPWWAPCCLAQTCKRCLMFDSVQNY